MIAIKSITRPNNTTAYSIGDVINDNGSTIPIVLDLNGGANPALIFNHLVSSNEASTPAIDVHFYSESFTIAADNAAFNPSDAQQLKRLGTISHTDWVAWTANKTSDAKPDAPICLGTGVTPFVYVVLTAAAAYTPTAQEVITIKSDID